MLYEVFAFLVLILQFLILFTCFFVIVSFRFISNVRRSRAQKIREKLKKSVFDSLMQQQSASQDTQIDFSSISWQDIITIVEEIDQKIQDQSWDVLKEQILKTYALKKARQSCKSSAWMKRSFALRAFEILHLEEDEEVVIHLLRDSHFLVRLRAAYAASAYISQNALIGVLKTMANENPFARLFFRDIFCHSRNKIKIIKLLQNLYESIDDNLKAIALDIISLQTDERLFHISQKASQSSDYCTRQIAVRAISLFPRKESEEIILKALSDESIEVQIEACKGVAKLQITQAVSQLLEMLSHPNWWLRFQAALTLREFNDSGKELLALQDPDISREAYEIAQYVLSLPAV